MIKWLGAHIITLVLLACASIGATMLYEHFKTPTATTVQTTPDTKTVYVNVPVVTEKVVNRVITDPKSRAQIAALLAENKRLATTVTQVSDTTATVDTKGGTTAGGVLTTTLPTVPGGESVYTYKDWQLAAQYTSKLFTYDLTQKFEIVSSTGKNALTGQPIELIKLFQVGPDGTRIPVPAQTTAVFADPTQTHWFMALNLQGGVGLTAGASGGIAGVQWLKHGRTNAPGDITYAVATPVAFLTSTVKELGLEPVSFNLGSIPRQPFTNLWVAPYVSRSRIGITLTATF